MKLPVIPGFFLHLMRGAAAASRLVLAAALSLLLAAHAMAQWEGWDYDFDREIKPWAEMQGRLPAYPTDQNLILLDVSAVTPHRFFVDAASVSVGNDEVVRYTLMIKTAGGATNVSFEGIRCATREQKYYAIGRSDKTWVRARNPQWRPIAFKDVNAQHFTLYSEFMCNGKFMMESTEQIVQALRRGPQQSGGGS